MTEEAFLTRARRSFHSALLASVLRTDARGVPSNADKDSTTSVRIAMNLLAALGTDVQGQRLAGQISGRQFEEICTTYLRTTFQRLQRLRPGEWEIVKGIGGGRLALAQFDQYDHLAALDTAAKANPQLAAALGTDYLIKPDIVIMRQPVPDVTLNADEVLVDAEHARLTSLRRINNVKPILHASVSCKWTIRSDRAQNARSEALNLIRNRKGRLPHIAVITAEPLPSRIASLALGTGDIDCVYHFALDELHHTVQSLGMGDAHEMVQMMIEGKRLRDIADLPLDLVI
ncbi:MAG: restriction endonuclease [Chloroflexaceae bacterium]|nr:restriction endonuclease [Chloroflexaceae bacterium]NJO07340.1 restriction endonuclease [Chloroflexaceae bacterium]NJO84637.1 restriction endonuclease [Blastochloris sp.]